MKPNLTVIEGGAPYFVEPLEELLTKAKDGTLQSLCLAWADETGSQHRFITAPGSSSVELLGATHLAAALLTDHIRGKD